jgi:hypothetical protein
MSSSSSSMTWAGWTAAFTARSIMRRRTSTASRSGRCGSRMRMRSPVLAHAGEHPERAVHRAARHHDRERTSATTGGRACVFEGTGAAECANAAPGEQELPGTFADHAGGDAEGRGLSHGAHRQVALGLTQPHWPEQQGFDVAFHCHPDPGPPGEYFSPYGVLPEGSPNAKQRVGTITDGPQANTSSIVRRRRR